jgi:hypothetical protein
MTMLLNIKTFSWMAIHKAMYNRTMTKQTPRKRSSMIFLVLGLVFLTIGFATDQTAFTWIAIAFVLISLLAGGKWLRRRK